MGATKDSMAKRKLDTNLLFEDLGIELSLVNEVLHFAAYDKPNAYGPRNWKKGGEEFIYELKAARHRHWLATQRGERLDPESGRPHRAHIIACDLFLMHFEAKEELDNYHSVLLYCSKCNRLCKIKGRPGQTINKPYVCGDCQ